MLQKEGFLKVVYVDNRRLEKTFSLPHVNQIIIILYDFMRFHVSVITEYFACTVRIFSIVGRCTRKSVLFSRLWTGEINMGLILNFT